jgi:hypothetical protein
VRRARRILWTTVVALLIALGCAVDAEGVAVMIPPRQELAAVAGGVVWVDQGPALLSGFSSASSVLGSVDGFGGRGRQLASSRDAVAVLTDERWLGSVLPAPLSPLAEPRPVNGGECVGWVPAVSPSADFAVVGDDLVSAGECKGSPDVVGEQGAATRQPLFIRDLRGGRWRVLRWLAGGEPPMLRGGGDALAIGTQLSPRLMRVALVALPGGGTKTRFDVPDGYLSFASRERLVLSVPTDSWPEEADFPLPPAIDGYREAGPTSYELSLYSTGGDRLAALGSASSLPLVSDMHLVSKEAAEDGSTLSVRSLPDGTSRQVVGFDAPARTLLALAFQWPDLTIAQTTSTPLAQAEIGCWNSEYGPASTPSLSSFDLAQEDAFDAAPPLAHLARPPLSACGPAPPVPEEDSSAASVEHELGGGAQRRRVA